MHSLAKNIALTLVTTFLTMLFIVAVQLSLADYDEDIISLEGLHVAELANSSEPVPNFANYANTIEKKQAFFSYLLPEIRRQNTIVSKEREMVIALKQLVDDDEILDPHHTLVLTSLTKKYQLNRNKDLSNKSKLAVLLHRVDIIPEALILVQAANESGWGTSRFATKGYNFFGLWCFKQGCGFVPKQRNDGAIHEVAKFRNLSHAVMTYIRNLNRHDAYQTLRDIRADLRLAEQTISAEALVHGLSKYSERGQDYIDELLSMLRVNRQYMEIKP